ncbi:16S rRNA (guanine(527)-N(7))-methyltransferase RsmG [Paenibacillus sp. ACRRX]|uniref:16S rRNA (guanine(527)-N(7))-methyltransferase RsmG n=1 Tax=unclassified Paenibacillus TaxID=185978 RepID=UPI001EF42158|nr:MULTISPECIES: 16S rRNA (guanine(527)-N(7))-methyltransferase RsmG [unclassified Paenibacillus]MCG7408385.1 16S rRNA (guanine(527)-N(7))-methyltransferase RsmG [Paenibacillus sp. ACRRX]MDK8181230.1 16S rRNA (guanine(527)-N(7))-methyltransferase RsmG [Paenibacillus sp. UMB4589-SE434]
MDNVQQQFAGWLEPYGLSVSERQFEQLDRYVEVLADWNERMNLTGITERSAVYEKHFYDSITLSFHVPMMSVQKMADIGSGAGFPGIPLKILFPHIQLTIIDSLNKRIQFLEHLAGSLELEGVTCVHARAEEAARKPEHRDNYDLVTARAVARLNVLNEFCLPFTRKGGVFAAMKGSNPTDEIAEAARSMQVLQAKLAGDHKLMLPVEQSERHIVVLEKTGLTPKAYPRKPGTPIRTPII